MIMILHETVGVDLDAIDRRDLAQQLQEHLAMGHGPEDSPATGATVHDVVPGAFVFDPKRAGHGGRLVG